MKQQQLKMEDHKQKKVESTFKYITHSQIRNK